jgi:tRNA nucleotidyltransferase (CCA-adding enzyme)
MLAILAHDFGKPATTHQALKDGRLRIVSPGHDALGGDLAKTFLERIDAPVAVQERIIPLVVNHLVHFQTITDRTVRRLARRLAPESIANLCLIITADSMGRPPSPAVEPESARQLLAKAHELSVQAKPPAPILLGRHLLELGMAPGKDIGIITRQAYEAQLEGAFFDLTQALRWLLLQTDLPLPEAARDQLQQNLAANSRAPVG